MTGRMTTACLEATTLKSRQARDVSGRTGEMCEVTEAEARGEIVKNWSASAIAARHDGLMLHVGTGAAALSTRVEPTHRAWYQDSKFRER